MTSTERPAAKKRVLVAGAGVAGLEAMLALRALADDFVDVEVLAPEMHFWYRPLAVAEPFAAGPVHRFELPALVSESGGTFTHGELGAVEPDRHVARTAHGSEIPYDALVVASGARPRAAVPGAFTFRGPADSEALRRLLDAVAGESSARLVFALPGGVVWPLPLYDLALLTATDFARRGVRGVRVVLSTHEDRPLELFGSRASEAVHALLEERGVELHTGTYPVAFAEGKLMLAPAGELAADRVVSLPKLEGAPIPGLPHDEAGFVRTDGSGRVPGRPDIYAAGDITAFPVKQGGIAAQQADAVAEAIAAEAGAAVEPQPFHPVLRGLLLTGGTPAYLRTELDGGHGESSVVAAEPSWWPPGKVFGRYLAPFLATYGELDLTYPLAAVDARATG